MASSAVFLTTAGMVSSPASLRRPQPALAHDQLVLRLARRRARRADARRSAAARRTRGSRRPAPRAPRARNSGAAAAGSARCRRATGWPGARRAPPPGRPSAVARPCGKKTSTGRSPSSAVGMSAPMPRPSPVRFGAAPSALAPRRAISAAASRYESDPGELRVVADDALPVAGRLRDAHRSRDERVSTCSGKCSRTSSTTWLARLVRESYMVSRIVETRELRIEVPLDELDVVEQLAEPLERVVLALDRDEHLARRHERVDRQQAERRRAVDEDVVECSYSRLREERVERRRAAAARAPRATPVRSRRRRGGWSPARSTARRTPGCSARRPRIGTSLMITS